MSDIRTRWRGWRLGAGGGCCWQVDVNGYVPESDKRVLVAPRSRER